jgi:hypothetical protein
MFCLQIYSNNVPKFPGLLSFRTYRHTIIAAVLKSSSSRKAYSYQCRIQGILMTWLEGWRGFMELREYCRLFR